MPHIAYCDFILDGNSCQIKLKLQVNKNAALGAFEYIDSHYSTTVQDGVEIEKYRGLYDEGR